ncbi:hypothetical protein BP6252_02309 [Coleophoma cylindrospora]|uniref:Uncharacterized protein n=1 Tax=Coleophoma cylindrospora TaxID=1849047 RepID=A0A3D8SEH2_9HELO|nr:hypothetical protein BP6252_02309 [Coleophoma cylindrospora]
MPWVRAGDETGLYHIIIGGLSFCSTPSSVKDFLRSRPDGPIDIDHCEMDSIGGGWVRVKGRDNYAKAYSMPLNTSYLLYNIAEATNRSAPRCLLGWEMHLRSGGKRHGVAYAAREIAIKEPGTAQPATSTSTSIRIRISNLHFRASYAATPATTLTHPLAARSLDQPKRTVAGNAIAFPRIPEPRQQPATYAPAYALPQNVTYPRPPAPPSGPGSAMLASPAASPRVQPAPAAPAAPATPSPRSAQSASAPSPHPARSHAAGAQPRSMTPRVVNGSSSRHSADSSKKPAR